jgi:mono/diheme cytochrome c family protein
MKTISALFVVLAFTACSTKLYVPSDSNVNKRQSATLAELQKGHELYKSNCGNCHKIAKPGEYSADQWTKILEKMGPKAKLNQAQVALVYKYVVNY